MQANEILENRPVLDPFERAVIEEEIRRKEICRELRGLSNLLLSEISSRNLEPEILANLKEQTIEKLDYDIQMHEKLMQYLKITFKKDLMIALRKNKNLIYLKRAKHFVELNFNQLLNQPIDSYIVINPDVKITFENPACQIGVSTTNVAQ